MSRLVLSIEIGALADPIAEQVAACGVVLPDDEGKRLQALADSIIRLRIHSILTAAEATRAEQRLFREIRSAALKARRAA